MAAFFYIKYGAEYMVVMYDCTYWSTWSLDVVYSYSVYTWSYDMCTVFDDKSVYNRLKSAILFSGLN